MLSKAELRIAFRFAPDWLDHHLDGTTRSSIEPTLDGPGCLAGDSDEATALDERGLGLLPDA